MYVRVRAESEEGGREGEKDVVPGVHRTGMTTRECFLERRSPCRDFQSHIPSGSDRPPRPPGRDLPINRSFSTNS